MLDALKFVSPAIAKGDLQPVLQHIRVENNRAFASNGKLTLSAPFELNCEGSYNAKMLIAAMGNVGDKAKFTQMANALQIKSGKFTATVPSTSDPYPSVQAFGNPVAIGPILGIIKVMRDFLGEDSHYEWARSLLFRGNSVFATNNVIVAEHWNANGFPVEFAIPVDAVDAMIKIGIEPESVAFGPANLSATFYYPGDRWLTCICHASPWMNPATILTGDFQNLPEIPGDLFNALRTLKAFATGNNVVVDTDTLKTETASVEVPGLSGYGTYSWKHFTQLDGIAQRASFEGSKHCRFVGGMVRGLLLGRGDA